MSVGSESARSTAPRSDTYDTVVVGAGMGGLTAAALLAKAGLKVLVVEAHESPGGYIHAFERGGYTFDPAVHMVLDPPMWRRFFEHLGVQDRVRFLEPPSFYSIAGPDFRMHLPFGGDAFVEAHVERFPHVAHEIRRFFDLCVRIHHESHDLPSRLPADQVEATMARFPTLMRYRTATLQEVLDEYVSDPAARIICGIAWAYLGLPPSKLAFQTFAQMTFGHVIHGGSYVEGGVEQIVDALVHSIEENGADVLVQTRVSEIAVEKGAVCGIALSDGELIRARTVVSNADPLQTFGTLVDAADVPQPYLKRLGRLKPSISVFLLFTATRLDLSRFDCGHYTFYIRSWDVEDSYRQTLAGRPEGPYGVVIPTVVDPTVAPPGHHQLIAIAFVDYDAPWSEVKQRYQDGILEQLEELFPGVRAELAFQESATPVTLERFTSNRRGAVYGWENTPNQTGSKRPDQETPIPGLFLVGGWTAPGGGFVRATLSGMRVAGLVLELEGSAATLPRFMS